MLLVVRCCTARRPLLDIRDWIRTLREADVLGALFLALALAGVILAFATADPKIQVFSDQGLWYLLGSALAADRASCCTCAAPRRRWSRPARCAVPRPGARCWSASSSAPP